MLAAQIDAILTDFVHRRIPFSHRDVAECIPNLIDEQWEVVRQLVFEKMIGAPDYRLSVARFVGEGLTLMCIPREAALGLSSQIDMPAVESERVVA